MGAPLPQSPQYYLRELTSDVYTPSPVPLYFLRELKSDGCTPSPVPLYFLRELKSDGCTLPQSHCIS
ncbi:hypothetical protein DPMN_001223 [Dreissena polymorpha]|uniref:Uncharacterized protein n=1 Tax=Dreissena polymorpha TaxID=45954 RepID=A0A9D4MJN7_DREPO|nr:hypothetical protein DPMN_001223 [Dreissena polymorpha]